MSTKFEVGDRVNYYLCYPSGLIRRQGTIREMLATGVLKIQEDGFESHYLAHPKQCRKLVKKKRRSVWANPLVWSEDFSDLDDELAYFSQDKIDGWIEFREVKVPKEKK